MPDDVYGNPDPDWLKLDWQPHLHWVQLPGGESELAEIVRILDRADLRVETLQLHQPSLDDVFLAQTGRKLEGSGDGAEPEDGASEPAQGGRRSRRRRECRRAGRRRTAGPAPS